jgi:hypothetical protein
MKRIFLTLIAFASAIAVMGCAEDPNDKLLGGGTMSRDPNSPAGGPNNTYNHDFSNPGSEQGITGDGDNGPVSAARYHGCTKITYAALGAILKSRGVMATDNNNNALNIYKNGASALGVANYGGRVPEALIGSTSAMAKQFDIFVAAAPEILANLATTTACQGVDLAPNGQFNRDGLSCITGTVATDEHVAVANQAVADAVKGGATQAQGIQIAISAALEAAFTCE